MQLTTEQDVFIVKTYYKTSTRYLEVRKAFREEFQRKTHQQKGQYGRT